MRPNRLFPFVRTIHVAIRGEAVLLNNANETAVRIARGALSSICRAVGTPHPKDSCELHDLPLLVKVREGLQEAGRSVSPEDIAMSSADRAAPVVVPLCDVLPFPPSVNPYFRHVGYRTGTAG